MAASGSKSMSSVHQRRGAPSQGQPKWWRAGRGAGPPENKKGQTDGCWCEIREQRRELSPRTVLNGGERGQEQGREAKKQRRRLTIRPRTNLNGGDLVRSTFLVLTFTFTLAFLATLVLAFIFALFAPFGGSILTFLGCNREKRSIVNLGRGIPFGSFGRAFARAHCDLRRRLAFHGSWLKAGIYTVRGGVRKDGAAVEEDGSVSGGPGCMPIGRGRSGGGVRLRPVSGMRGEGGGVLPRGAGASGALVVVLEAAGCGRRAKVCLARFIRRHSVAAASSSLSSSACRALRRDSNWWIVSSLPK